MRGFLVLLPPILTILAALLKKDVIAALFLGIVSSAVIASGTGFISTVVNEYMADGLTENGSLLLLIILIGILMEQINQSGGFQALSYIMSKKIKSGKGAKLFSWLLCIFCSTDDSMATVGAGTIACPVMDKFQVPRERLAFILSSTGSNFISMMPHSMYIVFGTGLLAPYVSGNPMTVYYQGVTMNAYAILSIVTAGLFAIEFLPDFPLMKSKTARVVKEDKRTPEDEKGDITMLLFPIGAMIITMGISYCRSRNFQIHEAALVGMFTSIVYQLLRKQIRVQDVSSKCFNGFKKVSPIFIILFMAFTFAQSLDDIGFSTFVTGILDGKIPKEILPVSIYLICCIVSYCTGSFASGMTIMVPLAMPLAISAGCCLPLVFAACMGGSQFGDQTSPISDIFIMSSMAAEVEVTESARVQFPYKISMMAVATVLFLIMGLVI